MLNFNLNILGASNKPIVPIGASPEPTTTTTTTTSTTTAAGYIVFDGMVLGLDAANTGSYPGSGSVWFDISGNANNATWVNLSGAYTSSNGGYFNLTTASQYASVAHNSTLNVFNGDYTLDMWYSVDNVGSASRFEDLSGIFAKPWPDVAGTANPGIQTSVVRSNNDVNNTKMSFAQNTTSSLSALDGGWIQLGEFVNVQIVRSGTTTTFYTNLTSSLSISNTPVKNMNSTGSIVITKGESRTLHKGYSLAPGKIGFVALYSGSLNTAQLEQNHNYLASRYGI
jgi:hypothetical protein